MSASTGSRSGHDPPDGTSGSRKEPAPGSDEPAPWWGKLILTAFPFVLLLLLLLLDMMLRGD